LSGKLYAHDNKLDEKD